MNSQSAYEGKILLIINYSSLRLQPALSASFRPFAPYDKPEIVLVVLVEGGGEGSSASVPVARKVLEYYFNNK